MATVSDEQKAGLSRVARQSISTVKPEEMQAVAHLGVTSETSIQDAKVQAQVITERYEGFEELSEDARKAYLSEQGKQGYKYQEENQLMADDLGRKHDVDDIYNITNADFVQMYENAKFNKKSHKELLIQVMKMQ